MKSQQIVSSPSLFPSILGRLKKRWMGCVRNLMKEKGVNDGVTYDRGNGRRKHVTPTPYRMAGMDRKIGVHLCCTYSYLNKVKYTTAQCNVPWYWKSLQRQNVMDSYSLLAGGKTKAVSPTQGSDTWSACPTILCLPWAYLRRNSFREGTCLTEVWLIKSGDLEWAIMLKQDLHNS